MKHVKILLAAIIFFISCPLSWYLAWKSGHWIDLLVSFILPTYGIFTYLSTYLMGSGLVQGVLSWSLGLVGSFFSLSFIHMLTKNARDAN